MKPIVHMVQCHCILPQYRDLPDPVFHKFTVFGVLDDSDTLISKHAACNNCGAAHKIYDVCQSEIILNKEDSSSLMSMSDLRLQISDDILGVLDSYSCESYVYEYVCYILDHNAFDESIMLTKEFMEDEVIGKRLVFNKVGRPSIVSFSEKFNESF